MTPKNKNIRFLPYILFALLLLVGILGYRHYNKIIDQLYIKLEKFDDNQSKMEGEFAKINDEYNSMMSSLSEKDQLLIEANQKIKALNDQLQALFSKKDINQDDLGNAKAMIGQLKTRLEYESIQGDLQAQIDELKKKNNKTKAELVRYKKLVQEKERITLAYQNEIKAKNKIIKQGSSLRLINFSIVGVKIKANGKEVETDKARKADKLRVKFSVNANNISESGEKNLYLCLYDTNGKLAKFPDAESGSIKLNNGDQIEYTDHVSYYYDKDNTEEIKFDWENDDFQKGDYTIKVYENGILIGSEIKSFR